ncbi:glycine oxidase [Virgibacillus pantothenticus]|uniref:glycine oxidase ThiO n=1 Tax=Virgibacillus TaxID=84406 RepID=UPI00067E3E5C|nr:MULTISPECIES: glycine oxidase ThiO [Virgibacillus]API93246.1 glycine oxidase ThiO [Virgibacillus sp. 6R]MBS7428709.1 glycine oxidase ThiO [Virgibacillus sp. 19R1-5]MBU8565762.1 glycine oxidase ThiO [Virgibacillus pantothenticus]MBU8599651.1 glycine oxidase ThiO [Virgibacillus pantothenticus]MBU8634098.1 glycine oxidase ThiO [Virgibacillus pantothenticus]
MKQHHEVVIVGGGIIGHAISYSLNKSGLSAMVIEKQKSGRKATRAAAGMLGVHTENSTSNGFYHFCQTSRNMYKELSRELYELTAIDIQLAPKGMLEIAFNENEKQVLAAKQQALPNLEWLEPRTLKEKFPMLGEKAIAALYMEKDGHVEPTRVCEAFKQAAVASGGEVQEDCHVWTISKPTDSFTLTTDQGMITADRVVVATGAESGRWFTEMGLSNPIVPVKGECLSVTSNNIQIHETLFCQDFYLVPKQDGRYIVGATSDRYNHSSHVSAGGLETLLNRLFSVIPKFREAMVESFWSGVRPGTEDGIPVIGEHPYLSGLYYATGHYRNGILLAPATAQLISDLMMNQETESVMQAMVSPERLRGVGSK